jgi:starch-binding outer membrane protein SusE/F
MKRFLNTTLAICGLGLLILPSCKKDGSLVMSNGGKAGVLTSSVATLPLDKTKLNDPTTVITFNFTAANYGFSAAVTNTLQIDAPGDNWKNPASSTLSANTYSQGYSTNDFNTLLLKLNLVGGVTAQVNVRVMHSVSATVAPIYSNMLSLSVTPYNLTSYLFVAGGYNLYSTANADTLTSPNGNGIYTGVIPFTAGSGADGTNANFKVVLNKQNFNGNYGWGSTITQGATTGFPAATTVEALSTAGNDGNLFALSGQTDDAATQIYSNYISLDLNKNTISLTPTQWSVVGDATPGGWPNGSGPQSDTDMKFSNTTQTWSVVVNLTAGGGIKFRLNHDWGTNYGSVTTAGVLDTANNNNINITVSGTYVITVDIAHLTYTLVKQ